MKQVCVIGCGMGPETVTEEGLRAIREAEFLLGSPRMLATFAHLDKPSAEEYAPTKVAQVIRESPYNSFAVLVSGDPGFFSGAAGLVQTLDFCRVTVLPGLSSLTYFFARLQRPWQETAVVSCHGRRGHLVDTVRRNASTFVLTGGNIPDLAQALSEAGFENLNVYVGENFATEEERMFSCPVCRLAEHTFAPLTVLLIENPEADPRCPTGIPDEQFLRGNVPMTKSEVRAVILSKLALRPEAVCGDIGAGTGSVTVEMALGAWRGQVYAVEREPEAMELILQNCRTFHVGNVTPLLGSAPEVLAELPPLDAVFIGGSGGNLKEIIATVLGKNPGTRIVLSAIALETVSAALDAFAAHGLACEVTQVGVSRAKEAGNLHLLLAQNPIFILSGGGTP